MLFLGQLILFRQKKKLCYQSLIGCNRNFVFRLKECAGIHLAYTFNYWSNIVKQC